MQNSPIEGVGFNELLSIINQNPLLITIINSQSTILYQNKIHIDLSREEVISKPITNFIHQSQLEKLRVLIYKVINEGQQIQTDLIFLEAGESFYYRCLFRPLGRDVNNRKIVIYSTKLDDTNEKASESREITKFQYIVDHSSDGIVVIDKDQNILEVNFTVEKILVLDKEKIIGQNLSDFLHKKEIDDFKSNLSKTMDGEVTLSDKHLIRSDGKEFLVEMKCSKFPNDDILVIIRDASEKEKLEERSQSMQKKMQQVQRLESLGVLAGGIAHEFNNVLTPIIGYSELIMSETEDENPHKSNLRQILNGAHRAKELVEQILVFSRQGELTRTTIEIQLIVKEALKLLRASIPKTIKIVEKIEKCSPILANPSQIHQMIMNMVTNAYQSIGEKSGEISITMKPVQIETDTMIGNKILNAGEYITFIVKDTGKGIEEAVIERIFEPFYTTSIDEIRSGLGLSVVHGIVTNHNGHIDVKSEIGKGTEFVVYFPIEKKKKDKINVQEVQVVDGEKRTIILVDDEKDVLNLFEILLTKKGYSVEKFSSSVEALECFRADPKKFDLIITDQTMPDLTGVELAKKIKEMRADIPIMLLTGYSQQISKDNYEEFGINEFIVKPVLPTEFYEKVNKIFSK